MMKKIKRTSVMIAGVFVVTFVIALVLAAAGDLLGTVNLPGNGGCSVAGTFDGTYYMTVESGCKSSTVQIYQIPAGGNGSATLIANKSVIDGLNNSVELSALAWDPSRNKLWGAYNDSVYLIDIGDPTVSGNALATLQFSPSVQAPGEVGVDRFVDLPGIELVDGLAYDSNDDSIWYSPDVHNKVYHFASDGTYLGKVAPKNSTGSVDGRVSGVVVGSNNSLYIGRDGFNEIRRVDKTNGDFISTFATTAGRVEDLTCDPVTYPYEAILSKDAYKGLYEAFEVEEGTCPLSEPVTTESELLAGQDIEVGLVSVRDDGENVSVKYTTDGDWVITELHLDIECELSEVPQTKKGNPKVGHFEFSEEFITPVTEHEFTKSLDELDCDSIVIAAHAVVNNTITGVEETAWADTQGLPFPGENWAMYFIYDIRISI
jgi:hypothetical protein